LRIASICISVLPYLTGRPLGDQAVIEVPTLPGKGDVQKPFFMQRDKRKGQKIIDHLLRLIQGELVLVGE